MAIPGLPGGFFSSTREAHLFPLKLDTYGHSPVTIGGRQGVEGDLGDWPGLAAGCSWSISVSYG